MWKKGEKTKKLVMLSAIIVCCGCTVGRSILTAHTAKRGSIQILSEKVARFDSEVDTLIRFFLAADPNVDLKLKLVERAAFYDLRAELLIDCAERESQWDTAAIHRDDGAPGSDSYGLLQVKLPTARWILGKPELSPEELLQIDTNIEAGTRYLKYCMELFGGDEVLGVAAYRRGPSAVKESLKELAVR